jgi:Ca2+-binding RTX toxin-like protein
MPTYVGTDGDDFPGNDQINNVLYGLDGNDNLDTMILGTAYVYGGQGNDDLNKVDNMFGIAVISGDAGNDSIDGGSQNDELYGGNDRDHITGMDGNDIIEGGNGVDTLFGEGGSDTIYGGGSTDRVDGSDGNDNLYGGAGNDTTIVITTGAGLTFSAAGGLYGGGGNDYLSGGYRPPRRRHRQRHLVRWRWRRHAAWPFGQ